MRWYAALMIIAILAITGFQAFWLKDNYDREKQNLNIKTTAAFRETIFSLQSSKLKFDRILVKFDSLNPKKDTIKEKGPARIKLTKKLPNTQPAISIINLIQERLNDSLRKKAFKGKSYMITMGDEKSASIFIDSIKRNPPKGSFRITHSPDSVFSKDGKLEGILYEPGVGYGDSNRLRRVPARKIIERENFQGSNVVVERHVDLPRPPADLEFGGPGAEMFRMLYNIDSVSAIDSITVEEINSAYAKRLDNEDIDVNFSIQRLDSSQTPPENTVTIGFRQPTHFALSLTNTMNYMLGRLKLPILFSLLLVGLTVFSFLLLYRNMLKQKRLADLKNEFISNITHELKTPIATVGVAIEALKNFNAIHDPARTKEYLDISQNELQRLNLLVDKVLKLSMFEKKEIELKYEMVDLQDLVAEVVNSMRLQFEKYHASINVQSTGNTTLKADRLHLLSVVYNLLDNALKYSGENPAITIQIQGEEDKVHLKISDNGIGIAPEYKEKIFEKFFRIPHGDTHNAKGYGLGLSYVAHVIRKHKGSISVDSVEGRGANFDIILPR